MHAASSLDGADMREPSGPTPDGADMRDPHGAGPSWCGALMVRDPHGADMRDPHGADMREPSGPTHNICNICKSSGWCRHAGTLRSNT